MPAEHKNTPGIPNVGNTGRLYASAED